jgi:uncharacterized membrane protein (TIGR02234 family)
LSVAAIVLCGAVGVIASTQTWLTVTLDDGAGHGLTVAGASAMPVLAPLSLAALALGAALSIVGRVVRIVFGALTVVIGALVAWQAAVIALALPTAAVAATVTEATGITGQAGVDALVAHIEPTPWPAITVVVGGLLVVAGVFTLITSPRWQGSGRRYRTAESANGRVASGPSRLGAAGSRPHDAIDSWDDLSRGEDPTTRPLD